METESQRLERVHVKHAQNLRNKRLTLANYLLKCLVTVQIKTKIKDRVSFVQLQLSSSKAKKLEVRIVGDCMLNIEKNIISFYTFLRYIGTKPDISKFPIKGSETDPAKMNALCKYFDTMYVKETIIFLDSRKIMYKIPKIANTFLIEGNEFIYKLQLSGYYGDWTVNDCREVSHFDLFNLFS
uniref:Uncharacterized protein n=1 Tax=viral metagenome TaxID=1070528 RepID=A0A6C0C953_9ZZZZ